LRPSSNWGPTHSKTQRSAQGERQAELARIRWEEQTRDWDCEKAAEAARKAEKESRDELLDIIKAWSEARRIEEFFLDAERRLETLDEDTRTNLISRLSSARKLVGTLDALDRLGRWKAPN
jgi:hypothetical protein